MPDVFSALNLAARIFSGLSADASKESHKAGSASFLIQKYFLPDVSESIGVGSQWTGGGGYCYQICSQEWENKLFELLRIIMESDALGDEVMEACGDVALFIVVLPGKFKKDVGYSRDGGDYGYLRALQGTETWKSMLELGRGRGTDYSFKLIKAELGEWMDTLAFDPLSIDRSQ